MADMPIPNDFSNIFRSNAYGANMPIPPLAKQNQSDGMDPMLANVISLLKGAPNNQIHGYFTDRKIKSND